MPHSYKEIIGLGRIKTLRQGCQFKNGYSEQVQVKDLLLSLRQEKGLFLFFKFLALHTFLDN